MTGGRRFRAFATSLLSIVTVLLLGTREGDARELRDDAARFFMDVSATGGAVCVVYPQGFADEACRGVPAEYFRLPLPQRSTFHAIEFPDWEATVLVGISENPTHRSLTSDEASALFEGYLRSKTAAYPGTTWMGELQRLERGELSTHRRMLAVPEAKGRALECLEVIEGSESLVSIVISFPEEHAAAGNALADAIMSTVSLPAAPPLRTEVAYGALKLLAGVPIVALFGLLRARAKPRGKK